MAKRNTQICFRPFIGITIFHIIRKKSTKLSVSLACFRIGHEEGVRMLYSGYINLDFAMIIFMILFSPLTSVSAALLRQATYGTIKIGIYQRMKRIFAEDMRRVYF